MSALVSIGLPVYNGEEYLREALASLLDQNYENFELIISDNASTDSTYEICSEYASRDARVKYFRAEKNEGASWNFNRVLELSKGEFFMWAAHDDLWHPTFISKCIAELKNDKDAVLCHSQGQAITSNGELAGQPYINFVNLELTSRRRWQRTFSDWKLHAAIYGLMKLEMVKKVRPVLPIISSDLIFVAEMSLHGKILQIPETLQYKRLPKTDSERYRSYEGMLKYLGNKKTNKNYLSRLKVARECIKSLKNAQIPSNLYRKMILDTIKIYVTSHLSIDVKETVKSILNKS